MGLTSESDGLSRIAGRLFGALLLADQPCSLDALAEQLDVSKASVSTEARRLVERGVAERIGKTGDRRDYYALTPDFFAQIVRFRLNRWSALHRLIRFGEDDRIRIACDHRNRHSCALAGRGQPLHRAKAIHVGQIVA